MPGLWCTSHIASAYTGKGHPDIYGGYKGMFLLAEVKVPGKKPEKIQEAVMKDIKSKCSAKIFVWTSVDQAVKSIKDWSVSNEKVV